METLNMLPRAGGVHFKSERARRDRVCSTPLAYIHACLERPALPQNGEHIIRSFEIE